MAMSTSTFSHEIDGLLIELSASLERPQRAAFEVAARAALEAIPECQLGPGAAFRALRDLQKLFFDAPPDDMRREGARHHRSSKLIDAPALGEDGPRVGELHRRQFGAG